MGPVVLGCGPLSQHAPSARAWNRKATSPAAELSLRVSTTCGDGAQWGRSGQRCCRADRRTGGQQTGGQADGCPALREARQADWASWASAAPQDASPLEARRRRRPQSPPPCCGRNSQTLRVLRTRRVKPAPPAGKLMTVPRGGRTQPHGGRRQPHGGRRQPHDDQTLPHDGQRQRVRSRHRRSPRAAGRPQTAPRSPVHLLASAAAPRRQSRQSATRQSWFRTHQPRRRRGQLRRRRRQLRRRSPPLSRRSGRSRPRGCAETPAAGFPARLRPLRRLRTGFPGTATCPSSACWARSPNRRHPAPHPRRPQPPPWATARPPRPSPPPPRRSAESTSRATRGTA